VIKERDPADGRVARVLVGMVNTDTEADVLNHLQRTLEGGDDDESIDRNVALNRLQRAKLQFRSQLMRGVPTKQDEQTIRDLREQLTDGRVKIKLFTRRPLHGKTYICHREDNITPVFAYVGSSNLT